MKLNCWEFTRCGRQPGGPRATDLGICPAASDPSANGLNGGARGGRICWALSGTMCGGKVQGTFAQKLANCMDCDFYRVVHAEEGANVKSIKALAALH
jgi:hypothetical protein